jgi:hypothetical protein
MGWAAGKKLEFPIVIDYHGEVLLGNPVDLVFSSGCMGMRPYCSLDLAAAISLPEPDSPGNSK